MLHAVLKREGLVINHKRTERIYREERLSLKLRRCKTKKVSGLRAPLLPVENPNERWSMDFIHDRLWEGRKFRALSIVDTFTHECLALEVDTSLGGERVKLDFIRPGKPTDNAFVESFHDKFRDECLDEHYFSTLLEARAIIEDWRIEFNTFRPHRSLKGLTPEAFLKQQNQPQKLYLPPA